MPLGCLNPQGIFRAARRFFLLFQLHTTTELYPWHGVFGKRSYNQVRCGCLSQWVDLGFPVKLGTLAAQRNAVRQPACRLNLMAAFSRCCNVSMGVH